MIQNKLRSKWTKYFFLTVLGLCLLLVLFIVCAILIDRENVKKVVPENVIYPSSFPVSHNNPQSYILIGDTGSGNENQLKVSEGIQNYCKNHECKLGVIAGDVIYQNGVTSIQDPQFQSKFETPYKDIKFPFYIAFGNHDYLGCVSCYLEYSKISPKWKMPSSYYTIIDSDIELFIINTEDFDETQALWLQNSLETSKAKYKIVVGHRPIVTYESGHIGEDWTGRGRLKDIICTKADSYIAGHSHIMEYIGALDGCSVKQIINGAGGAELRKISPEHKDLFYYEGFGYLVIEKDGSSILYRFNDTQSNTLYSIK